MTYTPHPAHSEGTAKNILLPRTHKSVAMANGSRPGPFWTGAAFSWLCSGQRRGEAGSREARVLLVQETLVAGAIGA